VVHACNPSYLEGRDREAGGCRAAQGKDLKTPSQPIKAGHGGHVPVIPAMQET
jgi:hypothetical protein